MSPARPVWRQEEPDQRWVSQARISDSMEIPLLAERTSNGGVYDSPSIPEKRFHRTANSDDGWKS